jgi:hypothetical protein
VEYCFGCSACQFRSSYSSLFSITDAAALAGFVFRLESKMVQTEQEQKSKGKEDRKSKNEQDRQLTKELEMSFPASDPPAATQPGSGITGPEATRSEAKADRMKDKPARRS